MTDTDELTWHTPAQAYLAQLCAAEAASQRAAWLKAKRSPRTFRYAPSDYVRSLIGCMDRNDEHEFKALKMLQGYASTIGV